ncbi:hypothetical protein F5X99DRAFT_280038 [Biscogniauxia marginata]|nr:hypothetical protein F5X99DRAFT_280038 [Biscogniauxia marginata]
MMNAWDDDGDVRAAFPELGVGRFQTSNLELSRDTPDKDGSGGILSDKHIYEDGLDTISSRTNSRSKRARGKRSPAKSPDRRIYGDLSLDQEPILPHRNSAHDPKYDSGLGLGLGHNSLDNTDALSISSWEEEDGDDGGMLAVDPSCPNNFENRQQDQHDELAERIAQLTRKINTHASTCLEVSSRAVELARENKHLAAQAGGALDSYVLRPCLRLVSSSSASAVQMLMRSYCGGGDSPGAHENEALGRAGVAEGGVQALRRECEDRLRRALTNCKNGRDMAMIGQTGVGAGMGIGGGIGEREKEVSRLKDRLVEQDAVLRASTQHIRRLMWERDGLRKQLESRGHNRTGSQRCIKIGKASDFEETTVRGSTPTGLTKTRARETVPMQSPDPHGEDSPAIDDEGEEETRRRERQLTAQLEELRILMDQMALHEISNLNNDHGRRQKSSSSSSSPSSSSSFYSSFFSAPEEDEGETGTKPEGGVRRQQKRPPQRAPPLPSFDVEEDPDDPEWTLL